MSLVSEALRKARQEAAEKGAKQRGMIFRTTVVLGSKDARPLLGWIVAGVVVASALAGAGAAWWLLPGRGGPPAPAASTARPAATAPSETASPESTPPAAPSPLPAVAERAPSAAPGGGADLPVAAVAAPAPTRFTTAPRRGSELPAPENTAPASATGAAVPPGLSLRLGGDAGATRTPRPAANATASRERSFVLDADLGKVKLHLDYIVYRSRDPFAGINGQQVAIGSIIEGFTVEEIAPEAVHLRDGRGALVLRIH